MNAQPSEAQTVLDILSPDSILAPFEVDTKQEAIDGLIDLLADNGQLPNPDEMKRVVWERENQRSTGIGEGIAIPHGKSCDTKRLILAIGIPSNPIEFDSIDGKPVRMLALLLSPADKIAEHIKALGRVSRLMNDPEFREIAGNAESPDEVYQYIKGLQK